MSKKVKASVTPKSVYAVKPMQDPRVGRLIVAVEKLAEISESLNKRNAELRERNLFLDKQLVQNGADIHNQKESIVAFGRIQHEAIGTFNRMLAHKADAEKLEQLTSRMASIGTMTTIAVGVGAFVVSALAGAGAASLVIGVIASVAYLGCVMSI